MKTYRPTTDVRVKAVQFDELTPEFISKYPMRYIIEDDENNKVRYELWTQTSNAWIAMAPGDWILLEQDGNGFYPCKDEEFKKQYEEIVS